jgi:predicted murein hydrolase (TIGR00659 family)
MFDFAELTHFWVYLSASPLLGLTITLCAYVFAQWLYAKSSMSSLANPVMIAVTIIAAVLLASGMSYQRYFAGAQFVHFLLGPATVALAVPLSRQVPRLRRSLAPLVCALLAGSLTAIVSAVGVAVLFGASARVARSIAPKSATTPIAMAVSEHLGGVPALTAAMVILTGILGGVIARYLMDFLRIRSPAARGLALGVAAHGIGMARAFLESAEMGAYAGLGMGLNGVLTALLAPWLVPLLLRVLGT